MALAAKTVTDALAARLVPLAATGGRVFTKRTVQLEESDLPCWRVVAGPEPTTPLSFGGANQHALDVECRAYARDTDDLEDVLSALIADGMALLFAAPVPYGLQLGPINRNVVTVGEAAAGVFSFIARATYVVHPAQPETLLSS